MLLLSAALLVAAVLYWLMSSNDDASEGDSEQDAAPVYVEVARRGPLDVRIKALGTVTPLASVSVRSRVDGELVRVLFSEGQNVTKGQLLAEIDPRPFQASLTQALGEKQQSEAQRVQARRELEQHRQLIGDGYTTQTKIDQQTALVAQFGGAVLSSNGRIADARLQLDFSRIRAPISGKIGLRGVDAGNLVRSGDTTEIASIAQMQPISTIFTIPETQIDEVRDAMRNGALQVEAWDRGERKLLATGRLMTIDNRIDAGSGTLRLRGQFANADERLFPNQFVNVRLRVRTIADAVPVPSSAIQYGAEGAFVYVVDAKGKARKRNLTAGASDGQRTQVLGGVKVGEKVVLEGLDRLKEGQKTEIIPNPATAVKTATRAAR